MLEFLGFISNGGFWRVHSPVVRALLRFKGIRVGAGFYIEGVPKLKIRGKPGNIVIGRNVRVLGNIDIRNRENGRLEIFDNVTIERDCRLVTAREGTIRIGQGSVVTAFAIINGGDDVLIGENVVIGPRSSINANEHVIRRDVAILPRTFEHAPVVIEDECWLAANVVITMGVRLGQGSVVAANAVVTGDTEPHSVNGGVPARKIKERL